MNTPNEDIIPDEGVSSEIGTGSRARTCLDPEEDSVSDDESAAGMGMSSSESNKLMIIGTGLVRWFGPTSKLGLGLVVVVGYGLVQDLSLIFLGWKATRGVEDSPRFILEDFRLDAIT